jgi:hypothetical protein
MEGAMSRTLKVAVVVLAAALMVTAVSACGGAASPPATSVAAGYAGLWVNPEFNNEIWLHGAVSGDTVTLRWEREWSKPVTQRAVVQGDGTLKAAAVAWDLGTEGELAYTGRLTSSGGLDMATTTHVTGVDAAIPVTIHFVRGSAARYDVFVARMNRNLERQRVSDAWNQALHTIVVGIEAWQDDHGHREAPPASEVKPGGAVDKALEAAGKLWPHLSDGSLVRPGTGRGQYTYRRLPNGYRLGGLAEDGQGPQTLGFSW